MATQRLRKNATPAAARSQQPAAAAHFLDLFSSAVTPPNCFASRWRLSNFVSFSFTLFSKEFALSFSLFFVSIHLLFLLLL
jgi:hypothetical protein